jgi:hypothetical protein
MKPVRPVDSTGLTGLSRTSLVKIVCNPHMLELSCVDQICVNNYFLGIEVNKVWPVVIRVDLDFLIRDLCKPIREGVRLPWPINMKAKAD